MYPWLWLASSLESFGDVIDSHWATFLDRCFTASLHSMGVPIIPCGEAGIDCQCLQSLPDVFGRCRCCSFCLLRHEIAVLPIHVCVQLASCCLISRHVLTFGLLEWCHLSTALSYCFYSPEILNGSDFFFTVKVATGEARTLGILIRILCILQHENWLYEFYPQCLSA